MRDKVLFEMKTPTETFICEQIKPVAGTFDTSTMTIGEPGFPGKFIWRKTEYELDTILDKWKETSGCTHGGTEKYLRKHWYKIRTKCGITMKIFFERQPSSKKELKKRWWLDRIQESGGKESTRINQFPP